MYQVKENDQSKKLVPQSDGPKLNCTDEFWNVLEALDKQRGVPAPIIKLGLLSQHLEPESDTYEIKIKNEAIESTSIADVSSQTLVRIRWLLSKHSGHLDSSEKKRIGSLCENSGLNRPPKSAGYDDNPEETTSSEVIIDSLFARKNNKNITCEHCGNKYQSTDELNSHISNCDKRPTQNNKYEKNIENNFDKFDDGKEDGKKTTRDDKSKNKKERSTQNREYEKNIENNFDKFDDGKENSKKITRHNKSKTKKEYVCESCEKSFTRKSKLRVHKKRNCGTYECESCNKSFSSKSKLAKHKRNDCGKKKSNNKSKSKSRPAFGKTIRKDRGSERVSGRNPFADPQRLKDTGIHQGGN